MTLAMRHLDLDYHSLDLLMPMHVLVSETGHVLRVGPTVAKLRPGSALAGRRLLEVFELRRPRKDVQQIGDLRQLAGTKLHLLFRDAPRTSLKGIVVALPQSRNLLLNLSFGISVVKAVRDYALTNSDFAPTDLAVEMLYLYEAKTAVVEESLNLNKRLHSARIAAEEQALTDTLTGLRNRRAMDQTLKRLTAQGAQFGLMHLDLDFFKAINDTLGHAAGDFVLQQVAEALREATRSEDLVARVGGDEFVIVFHRQTDPERLLAIAGRIITRLEEPMSYEGRECRISGSVGITASTFYTEQDADRMLSDADVALYAAKHDGRRRAAIASPQAADSAGGQEG